MEHKKRFKNVFDKTIAPTHFQQSDMVLRKVEATRKRVGKLDAA
jgi:hypothetical protein